MSLENTIDSLVGKIKENANTREDNDSKSEAIKERLKSGYSKVCEQFEEQGVATNIVSGSNNSESNLKIYLGENHEVVITYTFEPQKNKITLSYGKKIIISESSDEYLNYSEMPNKAKNETYAEHINRVLKEQEEKLNNII